METDQVNKSLGERYVSHLFTLSRSVKLGHRADLSWHQRLVSTLSSTPLLPQPVKFPSCKQYVCWSCYKSTFNPVCSDGNPFTCSCKKGGGLKDFKFGTFNGYFPSDVPAVKGLTSQF